MKNAQDTYKIIGVMSGTSLDGIDIAHCVFKRKNFSWSFSITHAITQPYTPAWKKRLSLLQQKSALTLAQAHVDLGHYIGKHIKLFIKNNKLTPDFIASHGHTIFHQPKNKLTLQIGSGASIAAETGMTTICDFRTTDVALGGQGAPLVPIGDEILFNQYDYCLNLGGFANISYLHKGKRVAFDVCPCNIVLNQAVEKLNKPFDPNGSFARKGKINYALLNELNKIPYYKKSFPKSLGKEWVDKWMIPIIEKYKLSTIDLLRTLVEHIAIQITNSTKIKPKKHIFITGGGTFNHFLIERIKHHTHHRLIIPDERIIHYKEALIFAFLGLLRVNNEPNCKKTVTGSLKDNCGGAIYTALA